MPLNKSTRLLRTFCTLFCTTFCLLISTTTQSVERVKPDGFSHWLIDDYEIYIEMPCEISRFSLLPTKVCSQPYIVITEQRTVGENTLLRPVPYFNLVAQKISIGDKWMFDGNDDPVRRVAISEMAMGPQKSHELFALLTSEPNTPLKFKTRSGRDTPIKTRTVVLADFEANSSETIGAIHQQYDHEEKSARRSMLFGFVVIGALLAFAIWLAHRLIKRGQMGLQIAKKKIATSRHSIGHFDNEMAQAKEIASSISVALAAQKYLVVDTYGLLSGKAIDNWSLGHVGGFGDAVLQKKGIGTGDLGLSIMLVLFMSVFGEEHGAMYLKKYIDLQSSADQDVLSGEATAGKEVFLWFDGQVKNPSGWVTHVLATNCQDCGELISPESGVCQRCAGITPPSSASEVQGDRHQASEEALMAQYGIKFFDNRYYCGPHLYDKLSDAIAYAQLRNSQRRSSPGVA